MKKILRSYQGDESYVFVSYAHKDKDLVYPLIRTMQENGYNVWFDEDITPASEFTEYIAENLLRSAFFIAMITPQYLASHYCRHELSFACNQNKKRLLIYLEEVTLTPGLQMMTTDQQAILKYQYSDISYFYDKLFHSDGIDICKSQSIRFYSGDTADNAFEIENGVLKKYHGDANAVVIPDGVTSIGDFAFQNCESLTAVKIADSVTSIGNFAFWGCGSLASVYIPDGLTSIGDGAFQTCDALAAIDIPESVMHLGRCAFNTNTRTSTPTPVSPITDFEIENGVLKKYLGKSETVVIPDGVVTSIGDKAFWGCKSPTSIHIPDSVTSIGDSAFAGCESLQSIHIPKGVTNIGSSAFCYCPALTSIHIPGGVTSIKNGIVAECKSLTSIEIPDSVTNIGMGAFMNCHALTSIKIPDGVTSIGDYAFTGCKALTSIKISDSITSIGKNAFTLCESLKSIHIPDGVTSIGDEAFFGCDLLESIEVPKSVTHIGRNAFPVDAKIIRV